MVLESPVDPRVQQMVDRSFAAARASLRPLEFRSESGEVVGGHYKISFVSGLVTGVAAGGALASLRWEKADRLFVLLRLRAFATIGVAFTTAQETSLDLVKLSNFVLADTGGTSLLPLGSSCRKRLDMAPSQIADFRVATTAALGVAATAPTVDAAALSASVLSLGNALGASASDVLFDAIAGQEHPLILAALEGFRVRNAFAQGAVGEVRFRFVMDWAEVPAF